MHILYQELLITLILLSCGIVIGFAVDIVRVLRRPIKNKVLRNIMDLLLVVFLGAIVMYGAYITSGMELEITRVVVILIGCIMYFIGPSYFVVKLSPKLVKLSLKIKSSKVYKFLTK